MARSTRRLTLTSAGAAYLEKCRVILNLVEAAETDIAAEHQSPRGSIRISVPLSFGLRRVAPLLLEFAGRYPEDAMLTDLGIEGYLGSPLVDGHGRVILYIASKTVTEKGLAGAYRVAGSILRASNNPTLTFSELKLVPLDNPIATEMLEMQQRCAGRTSPIPRREQFSNLSIDEAYVYPPLSADTRWLGIRIVVFANDDTSKDYSVEFWPNLPQAPRGNGIPQRVPRPARVRVEGVKAVEYKAPEKPLPHLERHDYEEKAVQSVQELLNVSSA